MVGTKWHPAGAGSRTATPSRPGDLLAQLADEYPELSWPTVALALEQACVADACLGSAAGDPTGGRRIVVLARDRLDVARERADLAARRVGRRRSVALPAAM